MQQTGGSILAEKIHSPQSKKKMRNPEAQSKTMKLNEDLKQYFLQTL